jgi:hypothetical protein
MGPARAVLEPADSAEQNACMTYSSLRLKVVEDPQRIGLERIITGDESWFCSYYLHDSACRVSRGGLLERVTQKTDTEKCRMSILWSVNGMHSLIDVPTGST